MMKVLPFDERTQVVPFDEQKDNVDTLIIANLSPDMNGDGDRSPRSDRKAHAETHSTVFVPPLWRRASGRVGAVCLGTYQGERHQTCHNTPSLLDLSPRLTPPLACRRPPVSWHRLRTSTATVGSAKESFSSPLSDAPSSLKRQAQAASQSRRSIPTPTVCTCLPKRLPGKELLVLLLNMPFVPALAPSPRRRCLPFPRLHGYSLLTFAVAFTAALRRRQG